MKTRIVFVLLVLIIAFSMTVPAFADPGGNGWGKGRDDYATYYKIGMGDMMLLDNPDPAQGEKNAPSWAGSFNQNGNSNCEFTDELGYICGNPQN